MEFYNQRITKALISLRGSAGWSAPVLIANPRRQVFSRRGPNVLSFHVMDYMFSDPDHMFRDPYVFFSLGSIRNKHAPCLGKNL